MEQVQFRAERNEIKKGISCVLNPAQAGDDQLRHQRGHASLSAPVEVRGNQVHLRERPAAGCSDYESGLAECPASGRTEREAGTPTREASKERLMWTSSRPLRHPQENHQGLNAIWSASVLTRSALRKFA